MMGALAFIGSPLGKIGMAALAVILAVLAFFIWLATHDHNLRAEWVTEQRLAVADAVAAQLAIGDAATVAAATAARERALADAPVREIIRHVPIQTACVANPGVAAAVDSVRAAGAHSRAP